MEETTQLAEEAEELEEAPKETEEAEELEEAPKAEKREKEKIEEDIVEERFYTVPLRRAWISPRRKRAPRAMRILKSFVKKHMKIQTDVEAEEEPEVLVISNEVNEKIWRRGIEKPPRRIKVRAVRDNEGIVTIYLAEGD